MFSVEYDEKTGVMRCTGGGFLSVEEVNQYAQAVEGAIERSLREFGSVAMLAYAGEGAQVQKPEVMEAAIRNWERRGPRDRMALVVPSALLRLQARRFYSSDDKVRLFATAEEAEEWLVAGRAVRSGVVTA